MQNRMDRNRPEILGLGCDEPGHGNPLDPAEPATGTTLPITGLGEIDNGRRLRLLCRADDEQIAGQRPRDTLDALGPILGRRCALIRHPRWPCPHPASGAGRVHGHHPALRDKAASLLGLPRARITITWRGSEPLLHVSQADPLRDTEGNGRIAIQGPAEEAMPRSRTAVGARV